MEYENLLKGLESCHESMGVSSRSLNTVLGLLDDKSTIKGAKTIIGLVIKNIENERRLIEAAIENINIRDIIENERHEHTSE